MPESIWSLLRRVGGDWWCRVTGHRGVYESPTGWRCKHCLHRVDIP